VNKRTAKQVACCQAAWRLIGDRDAGAFGADDLSDKDNARIYDAINEIVNELALRSGPWWGRKADEIKTVDSAPRVPSTPRPQEGTR
jgi:hypothetical protein